MRVPYLDLRSQFEDGAVLSALKEQFETCQFVLGPEVERFEARFAEICGTAFALGLNSGTDAIFLALKALGIGPGDEVITAPNSFVATAGAIAAAGAKPVFVDVAEDYNMDAALVEGAITPRTRVVLPVHLTGNPAHMPGIMRIAREHGLYVLEDACQAVTASIGGRPVGSFGDAGCFSLHPLKNLNVCGDGGAVTTHSESVYERIRSLRNHGLKGRNEIEFFGYNSRMDSIQAAIANHGMERLSAITRARQRNAAIYDGELEDLKDFVIVPPRREDANHVFHTYVVQVRERASLMDYLDREGVETKIHYPIPIHLQKPCRLLGYKRGDFPVCEAQAESIVSLPVHQHLSTEQIRYVADRIRRFYLT